MHITDLLFGKVFCGGMNNATTTVEDSVLYQIELVILSFFVVN